LPKYIERGLLVTLNTDDPEMFETTLNREYQVAGKEFGLSSRQLRALADNSLKAVFRR
jgi:aminodeoxyfutalosine deaminase